MNGRFTLPEQHQDLKLCYQPFSKLNLAKLKVLVMQLTQIVGLYKNIKGSDFNAKVVKITAILLSTCMRQTKFCCKTAKFDCIRLSGRLLHLGLVSLHTYSVQSFFFQ